MATIRKRETSDGKVRYQAVIRLKGHPPEVATFERKTNANKWIQRTESDIREGRHFKTSRARKFTVAKLIDRYVDEVLPSLKDAENRKRQLDWWKAEIGVIALTADPKSALAESADVTLDAGVEHEGGPLELAPRASVAGQILVLAALSAALQDRSGFDRDAYAARHPAGALGRKARS